MATTIENMLSSTVGEEYNKQSIGNGDTVIYLVPKNGMLSLQLNAATGSDTCTVHSSIENYSLIKTEVNLDSFTSEVDVTGSPSVKRSFDHGCTAYAVEVTSGTYTARVRLLINGQIYRG